MFYPILLVFCSNFFVVKIKVTYHLSMWSSLRLDPEQKTCPPFLIITLGQNTISTALRLTKKTENQLVIVNNYFKINRGITMEKRKLKILAVTLLAVGFGGSAFAGKLDEVRKRGALKCGVSTGVVGFSAPDAKGVWQGFDVGLCRAVAAAALGNPKAVEFVPVRIRTCNQ